jgi:hypothetical protein
MIADQDIITNAFHLVGEDESRKDLAQRRETKYLLHDADVGKIRSLLKGNARRLIHNEPISTVRSIYFDNVMLDDCQANLDGISPRKKVRLRWYDSLNPKDVLFFEIKWRDNRITGKHRLELGLKQEVSKLAYRQIINNLIDILPPQHAADSLKRSEPIVMVEYRREHFSSADEQLRATLDYDLAFYDQTGKRAISTSFPCRMPEMFVMEAKGPEAYQQEVKELLYPFKPRAGACSKYVHGCLQLGLVPPRNYH